jgi:hypothetical protein
MKQIQEWSLADEDFDFVGRMAARLGCSVEEMMRRLMRPLDESYSNDGPASRLEDGRWAALNLFDRQCDLKLRTLPELSLLSRLESLNVGKTRFDELDLSSNLKLRWLGVSSILGATQINLTCNAALETVSGLSTSARVYQPAVFYCTDEQRKRLFGARRQGIVAIPSGPKKRHVFAAKYNWDRGLTTMKFLIRMPDTDRGTALLVYWRARPEYYCQYAARSEVRESEGEHFDLIREIEERYARGFYTQSQIAFDPRHDATSGGDDWTNTYPELPVKQPLPATMFLPSREGA